MITIRKVCTTLASYLFITAVLSCGQDKNPKNAGSDSSFQDTVSRTNEKLISNGKNGSAKINGIRMYYEIQGTGRPLVLIHGGGSTINSTFERMRPLLAKTHMTIAMELQAHGRTTDRNAPESFEQDADDVAELLKQLHIDSADFLGFSNGGQTAFELALKHPTMVNKLILASAFFKRDAVPAGFWNGMQKATFNDMPQALKDAFLKVNNNQAALLNMFQKDAHRMQTFKEWSDADIQSIKAPTLFIIGDQDVVSTTHAVSMSHLIPHCQLAIIPGGHGKYIGEITTLSNGKWTQAYATGLIEDFLQKEDK